MNRMKCDYQKIEFGSLEFNSFMDVISLYVSM